MDVSFRVYDIVNVKGKDFDYDYVTFDVINYTRERVLSFSLFLDEIVHISEKTTLCSERCSCEGCSALTALEVAYVENIGSSYDPWPIDLSTIFSPRAFKFTETSQVNHDRKMSYKRPSAFINKQELIAIFQALQEALKRHHQTYGSKPYLAQPINERVDSMYQKVLTQNLVVGLQFDITRTTMVNDNKTSEAIYVVQ